jgi:ssDNA-specific exonuclease RecJ
LCVRSVIYKKDKFWSKNLKGRRSLEDLPVDSNDLKWIVKKESLNWIYLAQDIEEWRAVLKFGIPMETVKFLAR